jgi:hypothetical protein
VTGHVVTVEEKRRWEVVIDRERADWPDLPHEGRRPGLRVLSLRFWVDVEPDGRLKPPGVIAHGWNVRKDGSLGARSERWLWPVPPAWAVPLVAEALERIAATAWPVPVVVTGAAFPVVPAGQIAAEAAADVRRLACPPVTTKAAKETGK